MKVSLRSLFAAAGLLLASAGLGRAEEIDLAPKFDPFQAPEITLVNHCTDGCNNGCADANGCTDSCTSCCPSRHVGRDFWVCKDRCAGVIGGVDLLLLKPYASGAALDQGPPGNSQLNFGGAYRMWAGYQNCDGLGARIRYFEYNQGDRNGISQLGVEARYIDLEATQAVDFRRWNLLFAGGLRYAEYEMQNFTGASTTVAPFPGQYGFDGVGLTFAGQATRDLNRSGSLRLTSGARWSALYGNAKVNAIGAGPANTHFNDDLVNILEINIGPQYRRQLRNGGYLTLGAGLEAQYWSNVLDSAGPALNGFGCDAGFAGFSSTIAITR